MTATHPDCERVRRLVIEEIAAIEQAFAVRVASALAAMRPHPDSPDTAAASHALAGAGRVVLRMAGLPAERMAEELAGHSRTDPERNRTIPNDPEHPRTEANHVDA